MMDDRLVTAPLRLAVWQGRSPAGDANKGLDELAPIALAAGASGAAMLVCAEIYLPGYNSDDIREAAQPRGGAWHQRLAEMSFESGCGLTVGYAELDGLNVYNSTVAFDRHGQEIAHYRKIQLYGPREKEIYRPGDAYCIFDLDGVRTALFICYDIEFAPHVAALARAGVKLILVPTANMAPFQHVVRHTVPTMAVNHSVSIAYANFSGHEGNLTYTGGSMIAAADGAILAQAGTGPALLIADLPASYDPTALSQQLKDYRAINQF